MSKAEKSGFTRWALSWPAIFALVALCALATFAMRADTAQAQGDVGTPSQGLDISNAPGQAPAPGRNDNCEQGRRGGNNDQCCELPNVPGSNNNNNECDDNDDECENSLGNRGGRDDCDDDRDDCDYDLGNRGGRDDCDDDRDDCDRDFGNRGGGRDDCDDDRDDCDREYDRRGGDRDDCRCDDRGRDNDRRGGDRDECDDRDDRDDCDRWDDKDRRDRCRCDEDRRYGRDHNSRDCDDEEGTITISKDTDPSKGTSFSFSGDLGSFSLSDGQSKTWRVDEGSYTVTEKEATDWELTSIVCSGSGNWSVDLNSNRVRISIDGGESVHCEFNNEGPGPVVYKAPVVQATPVIIFVPVPAPQPVVRAPEPPAPPRVVQEAPRQQAVAALPRTGYGPDAQEAGMNLALPLGAMGALLVAGVGYAAVRRVRVTD